MNEPSSELILVPVSLGELADKVTILEIKRERFLDQEKLAHVLRELGLLREVLDQQPTHDETFQRILRELGEINRRLWDIEDRIRECEQRGRFDQVFIDLARAVYKSNDVRARLKREINSRYGSALMEEKLYAAY
jgi:hypothetical protein